MNQQYWLSLNGNLPWKFYKSMKYYGIHSKRMKRISWCFVTNDLQEYRIWKLLNNFHVIVTKVWNIAKSKEVLEFELQKYCIIYKIVTERQNMKMYVTKKAWKRYEILHDSVAKVWGITKLENFNQKTKCKRTLKSWLDTKAWNIKKSMTNETVWNLFVDVWCMF